MSDLDRGGTARRSALSRRGHRGCLPRSAPADRSSIIEAVIGKSGFRLGDRCERSARRIEKEETGSQRNDQATVATQCQRADISRGLPDPILARRRIEAMDLVRLDVDPVEDL